MKGSCHAETTGRFGKSKASSNLWPNDSYAVSLASIMNVAMHQIKLAASPVAVDGIGPIVSSISLIDGHGDGCVGKADSPRLNSVTANDVEQGALRLRGLGLP